MTWVDSHCHVHDERIPDGTAGAVAAAQRVRRREDDHGRVRPGHVARRRSPPPAAHPGVFATVGLHPHEATAGVETIADLLDTPGIVAVGEAGLDYYYDHAPREAQRAAFAAQIQLAHDHGLPLVIHSRDAWTDTFDILAAEGVPDPHDLPLLHRRPRRGPPLPRSRGVRQLLGHRDVQGAPPTSRRRPSSARSNGCSSRPTARTWRRSPTAARPNRPAWVPHVGRFIAELRGRDHGECRGVQLGRRRSCVPADRFLAWIAHRAPAAPVSGACGRNRVQIRPDRPAATGGGCRHHRDRASRRCG